MHGFAGAQQHRANRDVAPGRGLEKVVGNVGRVNIGQHQQIGFSRQSAVRHDEGARLGVQRYVAMHFPVNFQPRGFFAQQGQCAAHFQRAGLVG